MARAPRVRTDHIHLTDQLRDDDGSSFDASGSTPTLAEVLAEGNDTGDVDTITGPAPSPGLNGSYVELVTGGASLVGADGPAMTQGGEALISAGASNGQNSDAAYVRAYAAAADGTGGTVEVKAGDADGSSGLAGGDFTVTLGAGDGAGRNGLVFLNLPDADPAVAGSLWSDNGRVTDGVSGTPTLAEVLAEGNEVGGTSIRGANAVNGFGGSLELDAGTEDGGGGAARLLGGLNPDGDPNDVAGGNASVAGGSSSVAEGGSVNLQAGNSGGDAQGGSVYISGGAPAVASDADGGDITLTPGAGDGAGRSGLVFLNLPTSDPGVAGGLWSDGGTVTDGAAAKTPTLAEVLAEGADVDEQDITGASGTLYLSADFGSVTLLANDDVGGRGAEVDAEPGQATRGGHAYLTGGAGLDAHRGGDAIVYGGPGASGAGAAKITAKGGDVVTDNGGDVLIVPGLKNGAGRDGLVFLNLPTSDPGVAGALWADTLVVKVSAG